MVPDPRQSSIILDGIAESLHFSSAEDGDGLETAEAEVAKSNVAMPIQL